MSKCEKSGTVGREPVFSIHNRDEPMSMQYSINIENNGSVLE